MSEAGEKRVVEILQEKVYQNPKRIKQDSMVVAKRMATVCKDPSHQSGAIAPCQNGIHFAVLMTEFDLLNWRTQLKANPFGQLLPCGHRLIFMDRVELEHWLNLYFKRVQIDCATNPVSFAIKAAEIKASKQAFNYPLEVSKLSLDLMRLNNFLTPQDRLELISKLTIPPARSAS